MKILHLGVKAKWSNWNWKCLRHTRGQCRYPIAYFWVQLRAVVSYLALSVLYIWAISGTSGSSGFGSVNKEQMDNRTLDMVKAGLHCSLRISKHILPLLLMLGWKTLVLNATWNKKTIKRSDSDPWLITTKPVKLLIEHVLRIDRENSFCKFQTVPETNKIPRTYRTTMKVKLI